LKLKHLVIWPLSVALLAWLLTRLPLAHITDLLTAIPLPIMALVCAGLLLSYGLRAARLQTVLPASIVRQPRFFLLGLDPRVLKVIFLHNGALNVIPMRAGELAFPWLAQRYLSVPSSVGMATLLWMRLQDAMVLGTLGLLSLPMVALHWRVALVLLCVACWWALLRWAKQATLPVSHKKMPAWRERLAQIKQAMADPAHGHPLAWFFSAANWTVKLSACATLLSSLSSLSWPLGLTGALGGELAALLPIQGPAGLGTYEAGVVLGMHLPAASISMPMQALSAAGGLAWSALVLHALMLGTALVCAAVGALMPVPRAATVSAASADV
jgi:Lysylphosphatidylglycerol synthase TM region